MIDERDISSVTGCLGIGTNMDFHDKQVLALSFFIEIDILPFIKSWP